MAHIVDAVQVLVAPLTTSGELLAVLLALANICI